jgi:hypothetical protein
MLMICEHMKISDQSQTGLQFFSVGGNIEV